MEATKISSTILIIITSCILATETTTLYIISIAPLPKIAWIGIVRLIQMMIIIGVVIKLGNGISTIGLKESTLWIGFIKGLIWSIVIGFFFSVAALVIYWLGINPFDPIRSDHPLTIEKQVLFIFVGGLIAPIAEELFFRGILYGYFRKWGVFPALCISVIIFVMFHSFDGFPYIQIIGGIIFTIAYEKTASIIAPITIHVTANLAIFLISFF